ncbi:hypothetical protein THAOC_12149 [Thalassiosira oceanica]|uniref:Tyr recombinase domain-containing protein n=1 Tax=Thalassiosira oceanica TaxID=159749 RepID=K0T8N6_THAOC|nr:hypothetical protein THAOC_12149 [Thalassiosira oceanica]|eukprot:EJK66882.1 hypothetical protein THAOC_12149 [Thalassiosira oceanica]
MFATLTALTLRRLFLSSLTTATIHLRVLGSTSVAGRALSAALSGASSDVSQVSAFRLPSEIDLQHAARGMLAKSDGAQEAQAYGARKTHFLNYAKHLGLYNRHATLDPVVLTRLLTSFVTGNLLGFSLQSRHTLYEKKYYVKASTISNYLQSINKYYEVELKLGKIWHRDDSSEASRLLRVYNSFEDVARRRARVPDKVLAKVVQLARHADPDSFEMAMYRWIIMAVKGGFRIQEYAQDSHTGKPKVYVLPRLDDRGNNIEALRCFQVNDFIFYTHDDIALSVLPGGGRPLIAKCGTRFRYQKNHQNGQIIKHGRVPEFPAYDFVDLAMGAVDTARRLGQGDEDPLAVYARGDQKLFVTGDDITSYIRMVTRLVFPDISETQLALLSSHSLRVTACVLLHEEGKDGSYIKLRLRWLSDCYTIYLRNSEIIVAQHDEALKPFYARLSEIIAAAGVDCDVDNSRVVVDPSVEIDDDEDVEFEDGVQPLFY